MEIAARPSLVQPPLVLAAAQGGKERRRQRELAYMFWILGYSLNEGHQLLQSKRACFPKLEAIKLATADILTGLSKNSITLKWESDSCSSVEISGLDVGWGQIIPLTYNKEKRAWYLERELPEGRYEYKYIVDGKWVCNDNEKKTKANADGHVNNYVQGRPADDQQQIMELPDEQSRRSFQMLSSWVAMSILLIN
ncbi:hypothetical protein OsI_09663 [Oryza sativa Indica Group]|uniref:AMP-activated protein kinase glycogen-binding domain-containing protein n=1 Tax=Oryza sativa subsp. indica TaxID=39946 RepID=B8ALE1_ORYSI|nr:hypothetical protein OsI_09663 [Oryza sativa Indica Group]